MRKQVIVVGLGRFGVSLASSLSSSGHDVLALDVDQRKVQRASGLLTHAVQADATDEAVLNELGVRNFDIGVVAIGSDIQSNVLVAILLKRLDIPYVIARANNTLHGDILRRIGVDKVVFPEYEMGELVSHAIRVGNVSDYLPIAPGYGVISIEAREESIGQTLAELGVKPKRRESVTILLIRRGDEMIVTPSLSEVIKPGDILVVAGSDDHLEDFLATRKMARRGK